MAYRFSKGIWITAIFGLMLPGAVRASDPSTGSIALQNKTLTNNAYRIAQALKTPDRSEKDKALDASRKPVEVFSFAGVRPGMRILDLYSGGGYNTEIFARVVGPKGEVIAHNNSTALAFDKEDLAARNYAVRLPQVRLLKAENNALYLAPRSLDMVYFGLDYHDIYWVSEKYGWNKIDGPKLLTELYQALKPGGLLIVVDHVAVSGAAPEETGQNLHRIDPAIVKAELTAVGFQFDDESTVLRNPHDDHTKPVFDPSIRGKTDRFVYRFKKPI